MYIYIYVYIYIYIRLYYGARCPKAILIIVFGGLNSIKFKVVYVDHLDNEA